MKWILLVVAVMLLAVSAYAGEWMGDDSYVCQCILSNGGSCTYNVRAIEMAPNGVRVTMRVTVPWSEWDSWGSDYIPPDTEDSLGKAPTPEPDPDVDW